jgi:hypothetical protein
VTNDRTLTLTYDEDAGQVVLEGLPCGPAGEAGLSLAAGIESFFDCADGRLCKVLIEAGEPGNPPVIGEPALAAVASLFGSRARAAVDQAPSRHGNPLTVAAEPQIMAAMSRLARLDAVRFTSPVAESPLWAVEAARLARLAGLSTRVNAEACRAADALERADGASLAAAAGAVADLVQGNEPRLAGRLREHAAVSRLDGSAVAHHSRSQPLTLPDLAAVDERRAGASGPSGSPPGWLDPRLIPAGIFQHAVWPDAELTIGTDQDRIVIEARLVPNADRQVLAHCRARLVDPERRSVIAAAPFRSLEGLRVRAEIKQRVPPGSAWVEIVDDESRPVSSGQLHHIRRALRWAETALSAGRQVWGLADAEWVRLAGEAWGRCAEDWSRARDPDRAYLAAVRRAAICPGAVTPEEPSAWAKEVAGRPRLVEEPFLAERAVCRA